MSATPVARALHFVAACCAMVTAVACGGGRSNPELSADGARPASSRRGGCAKVDSVLLVRGPAYAACDVDRQAKLLGRDAPVNFSPRRGDMSCHRTVFDIVINSSGNPVRELIKIERASSTLFRDAVIDAVMTQRYTPAQKDGQDVAQVVRIDRFIQPVVVSSGAPRPTNVRPTC